MNTVLLVDDNPVQLRIREQILRNAGFEAHIATSGASALALLRSPLGRGVSILVCDHIMPGLSGPALVRAVRQVDRCLPILILSGLPEAQDEYQGLDVTFRQKPLPPLELIQLVRLSTQRAA